MIKINKNIVIAALARDCEKSLPKMIELIEELRLHFFWTQIVVVENDSKDDTKNILFNWEKTSDRVKIISQDYGTLTIPEIGQVDCDPTISIDRIEKMAFYRNIYLDYIEKLNCDIDYLMVIDIDIEFFSIDGLLQAIEKDENEWGAIFPNGITQKYYFGILSKIYFDCFAIYEYPFDGDFSYNQKKLDITFKTINKNIRNYKKYSVVSAFSGIGIYRYKAIKGLRYKASLNKDMNGTAICEHIPFNMEIINRGYKNYIDRNFIVVYGTHNLGLILKLYIPYSLFNFIHHFFLKFKKIL